MARLPRKVTFSDLQRLPEDGPRYELYDGEVWEMPSPTLRHQVALQKTHRVLEEHAERFGGLAALAPLDIVFSEYDVVQPDVVFYCADRVSLVTWDVANRERPDLVVEVFSPSTARNDRGRKLQMFARYGVPEYWILDPVARTFDLLALRSGDYVVAQSAGRDDMVTSLLLSDLSFPVSRVMAGPS